MGRKRRSEEEHSIAEGELNLVPYLDIMVNLIMFMLLTFQVMAELRIISFNPPASGPETSLGSQQADPQEKPLLITVAITSNKHRILTDQEVGVQEIPMKNGDYDYAELTKQLHDLKHNPNLKVDENIVVVAEADVIYDTVVHTLDALRTEPDGKTELFPKVTLGMAVGTQ